jgi:hypothetical protein
LRAADPDLSASALADVLIRDVAEVTGADDDIALLVMRFTGVPASAEMELASAEPAAARETRRRLRAWLLARGVDESASDEALRDADEALRAHAHPPAPFGLRLHVAVDGGEVRIAVDVGSGRIV